MNTQLGRLGRGGGVNDVGRVAVQRLAPKREKVALHIDHSSNASLLVAGSRTSR